MTQGHTPLSTTAQFKVLESFSATKPWLDEVCKASDAHRNEFGFLARSVFEQFARRDGLYVLLAHTPTELQYAGHLLFDRHFPRAHVRQIFVMENYRRSGAASKLLNHLRQSLTHSCFISIYARVAEDLATANAFWHGQHFHVQRSEKGGASRNRQILVRCHELDSPQLFPTSGLNDHNPLGLLEPAANELPMYLLDMNVLFDVQPRRLRRTDVVDLFQAERMNFCRLAISNEIRNELQRNLQTRNTDPMEAFIETFPCLPVGRYDESDTVISDLTTLVFPRTVGQRSLTANELSDLRHVITVIQHDLTGLITNDAALLSAGPAIEHKYGVQVLSSDAFKLEESVARSDEAFETIQQDTLRLLSVSTESEPAVRSLLSQQIHLSGSAIATNWLPIETQGRIASRCAVWSGSSCVGYITWPALFTTDSMTIARAAVDESHPQALGAARILLLHLVDRLRSSGPRQVKLELPTHQSYLREVGALLGFVGPPQAHHLIKSILGMVLTSASWEEGQLALAAKGGPRLPPHAPTYSGPDQQLAVLTPDGNRVHVSLDRLESLLAPTLFCLPGRPAIITPIRRTYAEPLLGHSLQGSLLPQTSASLYTDRIYLSKPSSLKHFKRGTLMFFYESGKDDGRSQVVAVARVREAYLKARDAFVVSDLEQSVLTTTNLTDIGKSDMKSVTVFDNIFPLPHPVDLKVLKRLGCGAPNDLITTRTISDEQLQVILTEAFSRG
jgi:ribosomal protein S18 acetylase RimI-like enzyme